MAALTALGMTQHKNGCILYSTALYGGTYTLFTKTLPELASVDTCCIVEPFNMDEWERQLSSKKVSFIIIETPSNPQCGIFNIQAFADLAHKYGALLVVDNTVATHALQKPLEHGADIVVTSVSKGLARSRALGGMLTGPEDIIETIRRGWWQATRPIMDARVATLMLEGMQDVDERMMYHSYNALTLATHLENIPGIEWVYYPWLTSHKNSDVAYRQMKAGGPLLAFEYGGSLEETCRLVDALTVPKIAPHITSDRTIVLHPASTIYARVPKADREKVGITDGLVRISAGRESGEDFQRLVEDFSNAANKMNEW